MRRVPALRIGLALTLLPVLSTHPAEARVAGRPNVLVVVTDDQRADTLEVMPQTRSWLADGGRTFSQAYVTTPLCCPSRASILSGRYAHNHGVDNSRQGRDLDQDTTVQARLKQAGYQTAISGKFLLFWDLSRPPPHFDRFAITNGTRYRGDAFALDGAWRQVPEYSTRFIGERALEYLDHFEADDERPWFLYVAPQAAHAPFRAEDRYVASSVPEWQPGVGVFEEDRSDKPGFVRNYQVTPERAEADRAAQLRTLMSVDDAIGAVRKRLIALGEESDTLVIFTSDNGYFWGEHRLTSKSLPYTEAVQVPLLLRWPRHVAPGTRDQRLVANIDITPTILAATGQSTPNEARLDGRSLLGHGRKVRRQLLIEYSFDPAFPFPAWASTRSRTSQYIEYYDEDGTTVIFREYYNLEDDPGQLLNLFADSDSENDPPVDLLSPALEAQRRCAGTTGPGACH